MFTSCTVPSVMRTNVGMLPCRSSSVCILTAALHFAKVGPGEQREAEVDGGRVERVHALIQIHADRIARVQRSRDPDQNLGEVGVDAPVVGLVRVAQSGPCHSSAQAHMVNLEVY